MCLLISQTEQCLAVAVLLAFMVNLSDDDTAK